MLAVIVDWQLLVFKRQVEISRTDIGFLLGVDVPESVCRYPSLELVVSKHVGPAFVRRR